MSLLYYCSKCGHPVDWTTAPPPWCPKCGADFKPGGKSCPAAEEQTPPPPRALPLAVGQAITAQVTDKLSPLPHSEGVNSFAADKLAPPLPLPDLEVPPPPPTKEPPPPRPQRILGAPLWPTGKPQWAALVALAVVAIAGPFLVKLARSMDRIQQFNELRSVWLEKPKHSDPTLEYVRGKVLPYGFIGDGRGTGVDPDLYKGLPEELKPDTPEEVATLAYLEWRTEEITTKKVAWQIYYILGYQWVCKVTLIDRRANKQLASRTFWGSDPTKGARDRNGHGDKPHAQILTWLKSLPRMAD